MKNVRYTGRLAVVRDGYGFIALTTVKKGTDAHGLETKHDIFVHSDDCAIGLKLEEGVLLSFECEIDQRRDGCFRAVNVTVAAETALVPLTGAVIAGLTITKHEIAYHSPMKAVAEDQVALARTNAPLSGLPRDEATVELPDDPTGLSRALMDYLATQFPQMRGVGISYEIEGFDESTQDARINDEATALSELCMLDQANELLEAYARFKAVRRLLQLIVQRGLLRPGTKLSPSIMQAVLDLVEKAESSDSKLKAVDGVEKTIGFMIDRGLLQPNTVIPNRYIVDLFAACPVWFWALQGSDNEEAKITWRVDNKDPQAHKVTTEIGKLVPHKRWYDAFQMFNRRTRGLDRYKGEIIPTHIRELLKPATAVFDAVAIVTPYHDVAGLDWGDLKWIRALDPYVIGFKWGLPVFFVLGRYSDSGIFPLIEELTADTVMFLRANQTKLVNFNTGNNPYWYVGQGRGDCFGNEPKLGDHLKEHARQMIRAFELGHLLDWLRGEWNIPAEISTADKPKIAG